MCIDNVGIVFSLNFSRGPLFVSKARSREGIFLTRGYNLLAQVDKRMVTLPVRLKCYLSFQGKTTVQVEVDTEWRSYIILHQICHAYSMVLHKNKTHRNNSGYGGRADKEPRE